MTRRRTQSQQESPTRRRTLRGAPRRTACVRVGELATQGLGLHPPHFGPSLLAVAVALRFHPPHYGPSLLVAAVALRFHPPHYGPSLLAAAVAAVAAPVPVLVPVPVPAPAPVLVPAAVVAVSAPRECRLHAAPTAEEGRAVRATPALESQSERARARPHRAHFEFDGRPHSPAQARTQSATQGSARTRHSTAHRR